jgi:hypothetical protein
MIVARGSVMARSNTIARAVGAAFVACAIAAEQEGVADADEEEPQVWQQLFFPFPIVGAPPQLEQQVQVFNSYFRGGSGSGNVVSAELAYILSAQVGVVLTVPFQFGFDGQTTGFGDTQLLVQGLAAGSLEHDDMLSVGIAGTLPTGRADLSEGDYFFGLFAYGAKRFFHHLIFEGNLTTMFPITNGDTARQFLATGLVSFLLTPRHFDFPVYVQAEVNSTTYLAGTSGLPAGAKDSPVETLFVAPEIFLGPFKTPLSNGTRVAAGVSFNVLGDPAHAQTYTLTLAIDLPNKYGY